MAITRKSLADTIDAYDEQSKEINDGKRETFESYRIQLANSGWSKDAIKSEVEAVKAAIRRRRLMLKDAAAVEEKDALVEEVLAEITGHAPRATRVATDVPVPEHDAETGEIIECQANADDEASALGGAAPPAPAADVESVSRLAAGRTADAGEAGTGDAASPAMDTREGAPAAGEADPSASSAVSNVTPIRKKQWKHSDPAHPDCLNPSGCGGFSNLGICQSCREAAQGGQVA
jgi:hypothetical protein